MAQTSIQSLEKIAKTSEDTKKLLGKLTKLNSQIGKKDETQATKLSSLVKKVADSSFTPTFLQKFLQKPDEEGDDLATRLEKTQNDFIGSFVTLFKNREAKEAARLNIEISKLRELKAIQGITKEEIEGLVAKEELKEVKKQLKETKEANTKSFENLVEMFKLDTSALETFSEKDQALLKENINLHGDVKKVLQNTELKHHETVQALDKLVKEGTKKGSLFVHDINTQEQLEQLNKFGEIEIEMAKDKMRRDNISALQDKEDKKQLLNATKARSAAGMGTAGRAGGGDDGGFPFSDTVLKVAGAKNLLSGTAGLLTKLKGVVGLGAATKTGMITGVGAAKGGLLAGIGGKALLAGAMTTALPVLLAGTAGVLLFKGIKGIMQRRKEFLAMSPEEQKIELARRKQKLVDMGLMGTKQMDEQIKKDQADKKLGLQNMMRPKLDEKTNFLLEQIEKKKKDGAPNILTNVQDNKTITNNNNTHISGVNVKDESRRVFGV